MRNYFYLAAGVVCLFTALLHTVGGQLSLVDPLFASDLNLQAKTEWFGAWHMITLMLWYFGFVLAKAGFQPNIKTDGLIFGIGVLFVLFSIAFIGASLWQGTHAPQYTLFLTIAVLAFWGVKKQRAFAKT